MRPYLRRKVPGAPADGEARNAGSRDDAKWHGQSERVGGMIDIAGRTASINPNGSACRIYAHAFHHREVDHQSVVATAKAWAIVAASTDAELQHLVAGEAPAALSQQPHAHLARSDALHPGECAGRNLRSHSSVGHFGGPLTKRKKSYAKLWFTNQEGPGRLRPCTSGSALPKGGYVL